MEVVKSGEYGQQAKEICISTSLEEQLWVEQESSRRRPNEKDVLWSGIEPMTSDLNLQVPFRQRRVRQMEERKKYCFEAGSNQ